MYDLIINARTADGTELGTVYLPHEPQDADKIARIRESLMRDGWHGRAVILADCGDHYRALSGVHRLVAAQGLDDVIQAVYLPADLAAEQWDEIESANDDIDLLRALEDIAEERDDMTGVIEAMRAEVAA